MAPLFFMPRLQLTIQFKGTRYVGWQRQSKGTSVQEVMEKYLSGMMHAPVSITSSGRTDSGVHAFLQVCHVDIPDKPQIDLYNLRLALNTNMRKDDISILSIKKVSSEFHAIRDAKHKTYAYLVWNARAKLPLLKEYSWFYPYGELTLSPMKKAAKHLVGTHDFKAFAASDFKAKTTVRKVKSIKIKQLKTWGIFDLKEIPKDVHGKLFLFEVTGEGFLKQMVRNIVGTLVEVGKGVRTPLEVKKALASKQRMKAGMTAPACGLVLKRVIY